MQLSGEFVAAILGALVGSVSAGTISWLLQRSLLSHQKQQFENERLDKKRAASRSLIFKLVEIVTNLYRIEEHIQTCKSQANDPESLEPHMYILPIINIPQRISISIDEITILMNGKENGNECVNNVVDVEKIHNGAISVLEEYRELRALLRDRIGPTEFEGNVGLTKFSREEYDKIRPLMIECNSIIEAIISRNKDDYKLAVDTMNSATDIVNERFEVGITLGPREGVELEKLKND